MQKLDQQTLNFTDEHIANIATMFPHCVTEVEDESGGLKQAIDFDLLKQELSSNIVDGPKERYRIDWPGKRASLLSANTPTNKTLRPDVEGSVNFDTTQNLYIEGDNLEALKLLQESYLGEIKMIYIDPPYNTGKDFVYKDNFTRSKEEELEASGQVDAEGGRLVANLESNGRFHSDWLSMMYPRLRLARNLLKDDGVIFISIDDNEVHNLRKICDEIFGEDNFISELIWEKKTGASDARDIATITECVLVYIKAPIQDKVFERNRESYDLTRYKLKDEFYDSRGPYYLDNLDRGGLQYSDSLNFGINNDEGMDIFPNGRSEFLNDGWIWKWGKKKVKWGFENKFLEIRPSKSKANGFGVYYKNYLLVDNENNPINRSAPMKNLILGVKNSDGSKDIKEIFPTRVFQYTKPISYIKKLIQYVITNDEIILDFFSGSATTAQAIMQLNIEDKGNRKFIMVQLPEKTDVKSEAHKAGYQTIAEIGKERIRRTGKKIKEENADKEGIDDLDIGFRVLKIDESNMKDIYFTPDQLNKASLFDTIDHIKEDRTAEDLLFGVLVDWGVDLTLPIQREEILGKTVFFVGEDALTACFDEGLDEVFITELAGRNTMRVVFKESGFADDETKINTEQIFAQLSPGTDLRVI